MNKKGLSDIITTVLIILIALAAVILIWAFIRSTSSDASKRFDPAMLTTNLKIQVESVRVLEDPGNRQVQLLVRREYGQGNISAIVVTLQDKNGVTVPYRKNFSEGIGEYEVTSFNLNYTDTNLNSIYKIEVYPIILTTNGAELIAPVKDHYYIEEIVPINNSSQPPTQFNLSISKQGTGNGSVVSSPIGLNCGLVCLATYNSGTSVQLNASAMAGSTFSNWIGCDSVIGNICTINMSSAKNIIFEFNATSQNIFGSGLDGSITISNSKNINIDFIASGRTYADGVAYRINTPSDGSITMNRYSSSDIMTNGIVVGDEVLIVNLGGNFSDNLDIGSYEFKKVSSINISSVTFDSAISKSYDGSNQINQWVVIQRVPNYHNVSITSSGILTSSP